MVPADVSHAAQVGIFHAYLQRGQLCDETAAGDHGKPTAA